MDKIKITGLEFFAYHGVLESEKELGQIFSIDCEFTLNTALCNDDLSKTVNYGQVSIDIVKFSTENRFDLLETLANNLCKHILIKYPLIKDITLTIHKPHAPISTKFSDVSLTVTRGWKTAYLGIGSNLGNTKENLDFVWEEIINSPYIQGISKSDYITTKPYGVTDQPDFLNGAIKIQTILTPYELLEFCQGLEQAKGRVRLRHWGERTLDVDILMYENKVVFEEKLIIPHPELHLRSFVLIPLAQIEPYLIHPIKNKNISELLKEIKD